MSIETKSFFRCVAIAISVVIALPLQAKDDAGKGLRFNSSGVLDLAERSQKIAGEAIAFGSLDVAEAAKIVAAPTLSEDQPTLAFSDDVYGCVPPSKTCSIDHERKLIDASSGAVKRDGKTISVIPTAGAPAVFVDWNLPATRSADGEQETHWYLGRLSGSDYFRVEVQFDHDSPGNFLINPASGKTAFVHNGSDVVVPSPDGKQLVTLNTLNSPLSLRVAALDVNGPRLVLQCEANDENENVAIQFKGWHDAHSFDFALEVHPEHNKLIRRIAVRLGQDSHGWSLATSDQVPFTSIGFACHASAAL
jgi:hypothetical protein